MNNLVYKEFKLSVHTTSYLFLFLAAMLLIPSYPYYVAFFYQTLGIFFTFLNGNTTNDITFTTLLPIRKRDAVKARVITVVAFELLQIIVSIPFAIVRLRLIPLENQAGMEANMALFGLVFVMFGIFNIIFLPGFYKTAYKTGAPFLWACLAMTLFTVAAEAAIHLIPGWGATLDNVGTAGLPAQAGVLLTGVLAFVGLTYLAYTRSVQRFEALDL